MVWLYKIAEVGELRYEAAGNYGGAIQSLLEKASVTGYLPAVYMLVDLLERKGATQRVIDFLQ